MPCRGAGRVMRLFSVRKQIPCMFTYRQSMSNPSCKNQKSNKKRKFRILIILPKIEFFLQRFHITAKRCTYIRIVRSLAGRSLKVHQKNLFSFVCVHTVSVCHKNMGRKLRKETSFRFQRTVKNFNLRPQDTPRYLTLFLLFR